MPLAPSIAAAVSALPTADPPQAAALHVHWLEDFAQVRALGPRYQRFLARLGPEGFFYLPDRLEILWPFYREQGGELAWLWVERDGEGVALAPLQLERKDWRRGGARCLHPLGKVRGALAQWYTDWLLPADEAPEPILAAIRAALLGPFAGRWDLLELELLNELDPATRALLREWADLPFREDPAVTTSLALHGDFAAYARKFKSKFVREVERERRKLVATWGEPRLEVTTTIDEARWRQLAELHLARQNSIRGRGRAREPLFESPRRAPLFRALLEWGEREGRSRHYWFEIDGRLAAFMLGLTHTSPGGTTTLFLQLTAVDERYAVVSPTRLLLWELLQREAREHGTSRVDFGVGLNLFKRQFGTDFGTMRQVQWINPTRLTARLRAHWLCWLRGLRRRATEGPPTASPAAPAPAHLTPPQDAHHG